MKQIKQHAGFFTAACIMAVFFFIACNNVNNSAPAEKPAVTRRPSKLLVTNRTDLVQKWSETIAQPELGGWYEKADAPNLDSSVDYDTIDPKKTISVIKFFESDESEEEAQLDEYTVAVLDNENKPLETTKLENLGPAKIQVVYSADTTVPVSYLDMNGSLINEGKNEYFEVMVADTSPPTQAPFAGFSVQRLPIKTTYDWKEPFDSSGLEVVKWYGGKSLQENGTPVIASEKDYILDYSAYSEVTKPLPDGTEPTPQLKYPAFEIKIKSQDPSEANDPSKSAAFNINIEFKNYSIRSEAPNGQNISGGAVAFGGTQKYKVKNIVNITFTKTNNTILNPESVSVRFAGQEVKPVRVGIGRNQLDFFWAESNYLDDGTFNVEKDLLNASFVMPAADATVTADFVFSSTRLSNLEIRGSESESWETLYGFSSNINSYEHAILNSQDELYLRIDTKASKIDFSVDRDVEKHVLDGGKILYIQNIGTGDTVVTITASMDSSSTENITYLTIKRFDNDNKIVYGYTGGVQSFKPPVSGRYKFTAWGAYGGNTVDHEKKFGGNGFGGRGAKAEGILEMSPQDEAWDPAKPITVSKTNLVYIYVGEGGYAREGLIAGKAAYNGGGAGGMGGAFGAGSSGGGATSISLTRGAWSDWQVLIDRILVAGGGGGYGHNNGRPGAAGGLIAQGGRLQSADNTKVGDANLSTGYGGTIVQNGYWNGAGQRVGSGRGGQGFGIGGIGPSPPGYGGSGAEGRGGGGGGYFG